MLPTGSVFLNLCLTVLIFRNGIPVNASFLHFGTRFMDFAIWYLFYQLSSLYTSDIASKYQWHQYFYVPLLFVGDGFLNQCLAVLIFRNVIPKLLFCI